jgi:hypothetical protein
VEPTKIMRGIHKIVYKLNINKIILVIIYEYLILNSSFLMTLYLPTPTPKEKEQKSATDHV